MNLNYQIEEPPEKAQSWKDYEKVVTAEWAAVLNGGDPSEPSIQTFLEAHPSMVPGAFGLLGGESGHYPWLTSLISQPPLPSYNHRIPDFMWLSRWSDTEQPVLIEIEAPSKRWFTKSRTQSAEFTQALNQIAEWKAWFAIPHNVQAFKEFYGLDRERGAGYSSSQHIFLFTAAVLKGMLTPASHRNGASFTAMTS